MIYGAALVLVAGLGAAWFVMDRRGKRRHEEHVARRAERQRRRIVEWSVLEWLYGRRANLRITHLQASENPASAED